MVSIGLIAGVLLVIVLWAVHARLGDRNTLRETSGRPSSIESDAAAAHSSGPTDHATESDRLILVGSDSEESDGIRALYRVRSLSDLEDLAASQVDSSSDLDRIRLWALRNCPWHDVYQSSGGTGLREGWKNSDSVGPRVMQKYETADRFWRSFCNLDVNGLYDQAELEELSDSAGRRRTSSNPDERILQQVQDILHEGRLDELEAKRADLRQVLSRSRSPALYDEAVTLYMRHYAAFGRLHPDLLGSEALKPAGLVAVVALAGCQVFGDCGAGSLFMANLCGRSCSTPMDIHAYLNEFYAPAVVRDAYLAVEILASWRSGSTDQGGG